MSVSARILSGTAASWAQIGITLITQIALVPLYLSYWSVGSYGMWIAIQSCYNILTTLNTGHHEFMSFEFLKIGKDRRDIISKNVWSGVFIDAAISLVQVAVIVGLLISGMLSGLLGESKQIDSALIHDAGLVLLMMGTTWFLTGTAAGLLTRALSPFGYYPRMAWWYVYSSVLMNLMPAVAVMCGAGLFQTGLVWTAVKLLSDIPIYIDMLRLMKKEKISYVKPSFSLGWHNFSKSLVLFVTGLFENLRQQGARLFLAPVAGAAGLAAFSTMRTGANVAMQGLHTITNPMMPELMRFLHGRDQARCEVAFGTVWMVAVALLAPALVVVQLVIEPLYNIWTRGHIPFNPYLFGTLSLSVLVYAIAQPAISVVRGNNMLRPQIIISAITAGVVVAGMFLLVPLLGILGGGISLLSAEIVACVAYQPVARKWMHQNGLLWPAGSFAIAVTSVIIAAVSIFGMILVPDKKWLVISGSLVLLFWNLRRYWQILPALASDRAKTLLTNLPGVRIWFSN